MTIYKSGVDVTLPLPVAIASGGTAATTAPNAATALGVGTGNTPTFVGVNLGDTNLNDYKEGIFDPTVTLVGGTGNVVPEYTVNTGRYTRIGNRVFVDIILTGDGGNEGAGTGAMNVALPIQISTLNTIFIKLGMCRITSGFIEINGNIIDGATTIALSYQLTFGATASSLTGADQGNTNRSIYLSFSYKV